MRPYLASLILGVVVGVVYGLVKVRSPAPPAIALLGPPRHADWGAGRIACQVACEQK
jgi:hypothetical protein